MAVGHDMRIIGDPHRLGMPRGAGAYDLILGSVGRAAIVAGHGIDDPAHVLEYALHTPKAAAGKDEGFRAGVLWCLIEERRRQGPVDVGASRGCVTERTRQTDGESNDR